MGDDLVDRIALWRDAGIGMAIDLLPEAQAELIRLRAERDAAREQMADHRWPEICMLRAATKLLASERDADREALTAAMGRLNLSTGHGDTLAELIAELEWQVRELRAK